MESITDDEKQAIPEFFEGRPSKTPDRYLKIRNYILDQWYVIIFSMYTAQLQRSIIERIRLV